MIRSFLHKGLAESFEGGRSRQVQPSLQKRCLRMLEVLDQAETLNEMNMPSFDLHRLHGTPVRYSIHVNGPWRITFAWQDGEALRVDLEQYHRGQSMTEFGVKRPLERPPIHPGEVLREDVFPALRLSVSEAARRLGVSRQQLHRILAGTHPITVEMALRIGRLVGNGPGLWLRMQQNHDLWRLEQGLRSELEKITPAAISHTDTSVN